jgi:hypothetical protein
MLITFTVVEIVLQDTLLLLSLVTDIFVLLLCTIDVGCVCLKYVAIVTGIQKCQINIYALCTTLS